MYTVVWYMTDNFNYRCGPTVAWTAINDVAINKMKRKIEEELDARLKRGMYNTSLMGHCLRVVVDGDHIDLGDLQQRIVDEGRSVGIYLTRLHHVE